MRDDGGEARCPRALHHGLLDLQKLEHGALQMRLLDQDDVGDERVDDRARQRSGLLDRDAVRDRPAGGGGAESG
jgi:hypothetical protein